MVKRGSKKKPSPPRRPTDKEVADSIRKFTDRDLIQIYQLAMAQLNTVAMGLRSSLQRNLPKPEEEKEDGAK